MVGNMARHDGQLIRRDASLGVHIRAIWCCLTDIIDFMPDVPLDRRVALRNRRAALERAYPEFLKVNASELAQLGAEADGDAIQDSI